MKFQSQHGRVFYWDLEVNSTEDWFGSVKKVALNPFTSTGSMVFGSVSRTVHHKFLERWSKRQHTRLRLLTEIDTEDVSSPVECMAYLTLENKLSQDQLVDYEIPFKVFYMTLRRENR